MRRLIALGLLVSICSPANAWNDKGHLVVARLAWKKLDVAQRAKILAILKKHPHYQEFLAAQKPDGYSEDEWVFMRAAAWPDWVRSHYTSDYHHATWHYINYPIVPPGSNVDPAKHEPPAGQENAVNILTKCVDKIKNGTDQQKAIYLCWMFHLIGDIHQPLHCVSLYSELFPDGDKGGNSCMIRTRAGARPTNLHSFWDGLLGQGRTAGAIGRDVALIEQLLEEHHELVKDDLANHQTFEEWAREGAKLARKAVYLDGALEVAKGSGGRYKSKTEDGLTAREIPADYASSAGRTARVQIGKAGVRLAAVLARLVP